MFKLDLEKAEEPETKLLTSTGSLKKQETCRKTSTSASLTTLNPLCGSQQTTENSERDGNTRPPYLPPKKHHVGQEATVRTEYETMVPNWERSTSRLYIVTLLI